MKQKLLFVDRDGCLIEEPEDYQIDSLEKLRLMPQVIPALLDILGAGYQLVMVTNQDGLGTDSFPTADFEPPHAWMLETLASQGITFKDILIDKTFEADGKDTRKPGVGMMHAYLADDSWSRADSAMVGDRDTDLQFAANMGVAGYKVGADGMSWAEIAHQLVNRPRTAKVVRKTHETQITVEVDLDAPPAAHVDTGIGFFDHMLDQISRHGGFALNLECKGDLHIDDHHSVEDCALALGEALRQALGDKRGIARYGFTLPMDETLAQVALDLSGRPYFVLDGHYPRDHVGALSTDMVEHFFQSLSYAMAANVHLKVRGDNSHHMVEASFKAFARALRQAIRREGNELPSTKGML